MAKYKLSELTQGHPLLQTNAIDELASYWPQKVNDYFLAQYMPLVNVDRDKIVVEFAKQSRGGMTPMVHMNAESPMVNFGTGRGRLEFEAASWREKVRIGSKAIYDLRKFGTQDELVDHATLLQSYIRDLEERLARRMEWLRRQVLFDGLVSGELEDGTEYNIKYTRPTYLHPTANTPFSDYANADPVDVMQDWIEDYVTDTGREVQEVILPHGMMLHLTKNEKFRELAVQNLPVFRGTKEQVREHLITILGVADIKTANNSLQFQADIEVDAADGSSDFLFSHTEQLEVGDMIYIVDPRDLDRKKYEVAAINGDTVTIDGVIDHDGGFQKGSPVKWKRYTIPEEKMLLFGEFEGQLNEEGTRDPAEIDTDVNRWGEVVSTRSHYADMENPRPGLYSRTIDNTDGDPPSIEYIAGIRALPRITRNDAWSTLEAL